MSSWDKYTKGGKFNANLAKADRTAKLSGEIERPKENKITKISKTLGEISVSDSCAKGKDENFAPVKKAIMVEIPLKSFLELGLNSYLLKWLESLGFSSPNRVQNEVLCYLSEEMYKHSVIIAPKKSGKTSAALLWVLNKLLSDKNKEYPKALMICPTFEKADATYKFVKQIPDSCELKLYVATKGAKLNKGEQATVALVIATPDKALELLQSDFLNLKKAKYLIFDDAHCMSDTPGHLKTLSHAFSLLSPRCRIVLCTLSCNKVLGDFIDKYLMEHQRIEIENYLKGKEIFIPKKIFIVYSNNEERVKAFIHLEKCNTYKGQTVVFCRTKEESNRLKIALDAENISTEILNGKVNPNKRSHILQQFKENKIKLLITTYTYMEVLEAKNVTKVVNYEQVLNSEYKLNPEIYEEIESQLNGRKNCLIGSFIEQKWEDTLIQPKPGSKEKQVYVNAKRIFANDLIDGQPFDK